MSYHYLNPDREAESGALPDVETVQSCPTCGSEGGNAHRTRSCAKRAARGEELGGWYVRDNPARFVGPLFGRPEPRVIGCRGPFPTEAEALTAAREAPQTEYDPTCVLCQFGEEPGHEH